MSLHSSNKNGGDFEMVPPGLYIARCYRILDEGTQTITNSYGTKQQLKVMFSWELLDEDIKMQDGRPYAVHKNYTNSLSDKANLRADVESWQNHRFSEEELEDFDLSSLLGQYCQIQVVHSEDGKFANVQSIVAYKAPKVDGKYIFPKAVNENVIFDMDKPDMAILESLSENMRKKIMEAPEYQAASDAITKPTPKAVTAADQEDIPITEQDRYKSVFDSEDGIPDITQEDIEASSKAAEKAAKENA